MKDDLYYGLDEEQYFESSEPLSEEDGGSFWWLQRFLAEKDYDKGRIDYSVLSVAVMTLGLIMVVEVIRHRIDHAAVGRPFFKSVLEGVYTELSTLGIVELFIWLLQTYYENLDQAKYKVFSKVHFALFYTAIINAFQSCIVAFFSNRVSYHMWVQTEALELNHYVEIREEFQRVSQQLEELNKRHRGKNKRGGSSTGGEDYQGSEEDIEAKDSERSFNSKSAKSAASEFVFTFNWKGICGLWEGLVDLVRYPRLKRKYNQLLVQVRFHELRLYFLQAYHLPLKLKVSDYLMRSELNVLIKLVHVSMVAWLLLTGATNLLYFLMGIVGYYTKNVDLVGTSLTWIFMGSMIFFVLVALALYNKMKRIFNSILHQKLLWDVQQDEKQKEQLAAQQLKLFWLSDPKLVIAAIQFMQFGYAVGLSVLLIFWDIIDDGGLLLGWYFMAIAVSYVIFVYVVAKVIPKFTLCTSLGQLVDERRLHETVSSFRLVEAKCEQLEREELKAVDDTALVKKAFPPHSHRQAAIAQGIKSVVSAVTGAASVTRTSSKMSDMESVATVQSGQLMADLVKLDTDSLRTNLPESEREALSRREQMRINRRKSVSDGVRAMTLIGRVSDHPERIRDDSELDAHSAFRAPEDGLTGTTKSEALNPDDTNLERLRARRRRPRGRRMRSVSDGVALMSGQKSAETRPYLPDSVPEEHHTEEAYLSETSASLGAASIARLPSASAFYGERVGSASGPSATSTDQSAQLMADLVKLDTDSLRTNLPESEREALSRREQMRRARKKSVSDGVRSMVLMGRLSGNSERIRDDSGLDSNSAYRAPEDSPTAAAKSGALDPDDTNLECLRARLRRTGGRRMKSVSDGVALMSALTSAERGTYLPDPVAEENTEADLSEPSHTGITPATTKASMLRTSASLGGASNARQPSAFASHWGRVERAPGPSATSTDQSAQLMADLVKLDTDSLRTNLPESEREALSRREQMKRRKSVSDGVRTMAMLRRMSGLGERIKVDSGLDANSLSLAHNEDPLVPVESEALKPDDTKLESLRARRGRTRSRRMKSVSDGVALMSALKSAETDTNISDSVPEEKTMEEADLSETSTMSAFGLLVKTTASAPGTTMSVPSALVASTSASESYEGSGEHMVGPIAEPEDVEIPSAVLDDMEIPSSPASHVEHGDLTLGAPINSTVDSFAAKEADGKSIDSLTSEDDHSDFDDVPEVDQRVLVEYKPPPTLRERFRSYYLSKRFVVISNVFGTMVAFFLVGQRVEGFLVSEAPKNLFVSFNWGDNYAIVFWILFAMFVLFLITASMIFFSLGAFGRLETNRERSVFVGAVLDSVISSVCLIVFCVAEAQRCCSANDQTEYYQESEDCCPTFGSRRYGGLGTIEPYTSLVALRIFRHRFAKMLVLQLESSFSPAKDADESRKKESIRADPFHVFDDSAHGKHEPMQEEKGTISELWETAVGRYPDIVSKYGEFSGELLRAMLGISVISSDGVLRPSPSGMAISSGQAILSPSEDQTSYALKEEEYSDLPVHTQEIIMAGKLGRKVKSVADLPSLLENEPASESEKKHTQGNVGARARHQKVYFEIDGSTPQFLGHETMFTAPNARLVRSMRRCDRKLLPILDKWTAVDVVMTRFEMVYFDAVEVDGTNYDSDTEATKQALAATKGGKGLRLCDVAAGRRVVGHLELTDIESIHVEREMPHLDVGEAEGPETAVAKTEYWTQKPCESELIRATRWTTIKQDVLTIQTVCGQILYLRFYSDLDDSEAHRGRMIEEHEDEGPLFKDNAFQWAQTITRYCGPEQLKQPLPHFGDDTSDELRDFLVVKPCADAKTRHRRLPTPTNGSVFRSLPRRSFSTMNLAALGEARHAKSLRHASSLGDKPKAVRRASSIGEGVARSSRKPFQRSGSMDDAQVSSRRSVLESHENFNISDVEEGRTRKVAFQEGVTVSDCEGKSKTTTNHDADD